MGRDRKSLILDGLRDLFKYATSRRVLPVVKATIAYMAGFALMFSRKFDDLSKYPPALGSMLIIIVAAVPGKPVGRCLAGCFTAVAGFLVGGAFFAITARLGAYPVAQAFVFAFMVYAISLVRTVGPLWFAFTLLAILMAFNGIYTSIILDGVFSPAYLLEYLISYSWGTAIPLAVNILIFPQTSESELRQAIVTSMEHISTFAALLGKAYMLTSSAEDKAARALLCQTIKADFAFLNQQFEETAAEIVWSKYSMQDYRRFLDRIRILQRTLITAHTSLQSFDEQDVEVFRAEILPQTRLVFTRLRRDIDVTIREIEVSLSAGRVPVKVSPTGYLDFLDQQRAAYLAGRHTSTRPWATSDKTTLSQSENETEIPSYQVQDNLADVAQRLRQELSSETPAHTITDYRGSQTSPPEWQLPMQGSSPTSVTFSYGSTVRSPTSTIPPLPPLPVPPGSSRSQASQVSQGSKPSRPGSQGVSVTGGGGIGYRLDTPKRKYGPKVIKQHFEHFQTAQKEIFVRLLTTSDPGLNTQLKLHEPGPSISELYGGDYLRGNVEDADMDTKIIRSRRSSLSKSRKSSFTRSRKSSLHKQSSFNKLSPFPTAPTPMTAIDVEQGEHGHGIQVEPVYDDFDDNEEEERRIREKKRERMSFWESNSSIGPTAEFKTSETLVRVFSLLVAWDRFVENIGALHGEVIMKRRKKLHFHFYEAFKLRKKKQLSDNITSPSGVEDAEELREESRELSIREALALLEDKPYTPVKTTWLERVNKINRFLVSDESVFAAKSAAAASVFALLIFASTTRQWFIEYSINIGLLTCIVALAPTLGQSLMTFLFQIGGCGLGAVLGLTTLQIFKNVGGYHFNPYGMTVLLGVLSLPFQYLIYEKPLFFIFSLLALNSAGSIVIIEHIFVNYYQETDFDPPILRSGKFATALAVAVAIVITFQLFVLRNPSRKTLRIKLGELVYSNLAYNTILQAYVRAVLPADPTHRGKPAVLRRIERELQHRETKMQTEIFNLAPLLVYSAVEPSFGKPFRGDVAQTIIEANQIILDRLREGRAAIGDKPFDPFILENMVSVLSPYRRRATRINKTGFYLCAASLMSKSPLPHDSVLAQHVLNHFVHDALLLSARLTRTKQGARAVKGDSFSRYWFYLISISGLQIQLKRIETACKELFGELEDDPKLR